jgi:hypothetical protein
VDSKKNKQTNEEPIEIKKKMQDMKGNSIKIYKFWEKLKLKFWK